jgi:DNA-binding response OmpR family regulator
MKWRMLCLSSDPARLLLYQSIVELDGHYVHVAGNIDEAIKVTKGIVIDCVVIDCEDNGIAVTTEIARARPGVPILFVSDQSEVQLQVYSETDMFVTEEEAIEELSRCICEVIGRNARRCEDDRRKLTRTSNVDSRALHGAFVSWLLPW